MHLIVGLGNPGRRYQFTRHNLGFLFLDYICREQGETAKFKDKLNFAFLRTELFKEDVVLAKPTTFMNLSGNGVKDVMNYFKIDSDKLIVCYDDLDLPVGTIRIRDKGSSGGHKGLSHIINVLGTDTFIRIRFGIDSPLRGDRPGVDYVLSKIPKGEQDLFESALKNAYNALHILFEERDLKKVMQLYNKRV
ncbi:MAG: aminoacyl-tRNA hydrolase [Acidobacteria bacterium]|nr:MAG: aminoacyl-tRNA hydrolase [Acidobacteriota bacterium]